MYLSFIVIPEVFRLTFLAYLMELIIIVIHNHRILSFQSAFLFMCHLGSQSQVTEIFFFDV